jgi:hypothetical protein
LLGAWRPDNPVEANKNMMIKAMFARRCQPFSKPFHFEERCLRITEPEKVIINKDKKNES